MKRKPQIGGARQREAGGRGEPAAVAAPFDPAALKGLAEERRSDHLRLRRQLKDGIVSEARADALFHRLYEEVRGTIDCTACANCCVAQFPTLNPRDVRRLAKALGMTAPDFARSYLRADEEEPNGLVFAQRPCPFLTAKRCSQYDARPDACRGYPHLHHKDMVGRLWAVVDNAEVCPIVYEVLERLREALAAEAADDFDDGDPDLLGY